MYLKSKNKITLLPFASNISMQSAIARSYGLFSFDIGLFTFVYTGIDREEVILPTINLGMNNFLNLLINIISLGEKIYGDREIKKTV